MKLKIAALTLALALSAALSSAARAEESPGVQFQSYAAALEAAPKENKFVMLFFWADWCQYCKLAREKILPDEKIRNVLTESFLSVSINKDKSPNLSKKYKVTSLPTFVFLKPNGDLMGALPGYLEPPDFLSLLEAVKTAED
jgi:thioredoxin-related protein